MPRYAYECDRCGWEGTLFAYSDRRDQQECEECGGPLTRIFDAQSTVFGIPASFREHMSFDQIHGKPGSPAREQFEQGVKSGEIAFAGKGSRWV